MKAEDLGSQEDTPSSVLLALREQTRLCSREFGTTEVMMVDWQSQQKVRYVTSDEWRAYVATWVRGERLKPAKFTW